MSEAEGAIAGGRVEPVRPGGSWFTTPLGGERQGRLEFPAGAHRLLVQGDQSLRGLCQVRFEGMLPQVVSLRGTVRVTYGPGNALDDGGASAADVTLNGGLPWSLAVMGGVTDLIADLRRLQLTSLEVEGGVRRCELMFSKPWGTVRVRLGGGVGHLRAVRPAHIEARLQVRGGLGTVSFDRHDLTVSGSRARFESSGFREAADRFDIEIRGGVQEATIDTF